MTGEGVPTFGVLSALGVGVILEAAIGIEPMNKGFAVFAKLFAQVQPGSLVFGFVSVFGISSSRVIA
jgi:hypothetical protein